MASRSCNVPDQHVGFKVFQSYDQRRILRLWPPDVGIVRKAAGAVAFQWSSSGVPVVLLWPPQTEGQNQGLILQLVEGVMETHEALCWLSLSADALQASRAFQLVLHHLRLQAPARWLELREHVSSAQACLLLPSPHWRWFLVNLSSGSCLERHQCGLHCTALASLARSLSTRSPVDLRLYSKRRETNIKKRTSVSSWDPNVKYVT